MRDGGRLDSDSRKGAESSRVEGSNVANDNDSSFTVGLRGNLVNVMVDEDGVSLFHVKRDALGIVGEDCIVLSIEMLREIYRRCRKVAEVAEDK